MLKTRVVKIGGRELDQPAWVRDCALALRTGPATVLVHGGGHAVTTWSRRLGLPVEQRDGLRVTTPGVAAVVEMLLAGPVNRLLVSALRAAGFDAIGLSGVDGGLLTAQPLSSPGRGGDLGHVGEIVAVRASLLHSLLLAGLTPVIAPVAPATTPAATDPDAVPLNVNADHAAAAIAAALGADELLFVSDVPGVVVDGVAQAAVPAADVEALIALGVASGGMAAKLRAAALASQAGVRAVRIGDLALLGSATAGTRLLATPPAAPAAQPA
ncbi:MAG: acetylglutamate kinase [Gemmatimonadales bacterium]